MKLDLLNLLKGFGKPKHEREDKNTKGCPEKPYPRQTDSATSSTSDDSRERPAFDIFDWRTVPDVDPDELDMWRSRTDAKERQFPLQVALQVHDELERELMAPTRMDALRLSEIRGSIKALARFAQVYSATLTKAEHSSAINAE